MALSRCQGSFRPPHREATSPTARNTQKTRKNTHQTPPITFASRSVENGEPQPPQSAPPRCLVASSLLPLFPSHPGRISTFARAPAARAASIPAPPQQFLQPQPPQPLTPIPATRMSTFARAPTVATGNYSGPPRRERTRRVAAIDLQANPNDAHLPASRGGDFRRPRSADTEHTPRPGQPGLPPGGRTFRAHAWVFAFLCLFLPLLLPSVGRICNPSLLLTTALGGTDSQSVSTPSTAFGGTDLQSVSAVSTPPAAITLSKTLNTPSQASRRGSSAAQSARPSRRLARGLPRRIGTTPPHAQTPSPR